MKPKATLRSFLLLACSSLLAVSSLHAATLTWDANNTGANQTDGAGAWLNTNQWWTGTANTDWTSGDSAIFGNAGTAGAVSLASPTTVGSLTFNYYGGTYTLGTASQTITLNNGINKKSGSGAVVFLGNITLGGAQTWTNNFSTAITSSGSGTLDNAGNILTIDGTGSINLGSSASNLLKLTGAGGIIKNGTGLFVLGGAGGPAHDFTGDVTINNGGILVTSTGFGTGGGKITINNGWIEQYFGNSFTRSLGNMAGEIQILGGTSGFSGQGNTGSTFTIGTGGSTLTWGSAFFQPNVLLLGSSSANANGKGTLANAIDLNGSTRTIVSNQVTDGANTSGFTVTGAITTGSGTAGLNKTGVGNLILTADNTYNGATTIQSGSNYTLASGTYTVTAPGSLTLSGASGMLSNTGSLALSGGGTLRMVSLNGQNTVDRINSNAISATDGGGIFWENTAGANSFAEAVGIVTVNSGQFNVNLTTNQTAAGSQTLTLADLTRPIPASNNSSLAFSAGVTGPQASGNKNMIVVTGAGTTGAGQILGPWATTGTAANAQNDYAVYDADYVVPAAIGGSAETTWLVATDPYTMDFSSTGATLTATRNIGALRCIGVGTPLTSVDIGTETITLTGHTFVNGDVVMFGTGAPGGLGVGTTSGTTYFVINAATDTFQVSTTLGGPTAVNLTSVGTAPTVLRAPALALSTGNNLGTSGILNGSPFPVSITPGTGGSVTLPSAGAGQLFVNTGSGSIVSNAPIIDNGGALTLVKSGSAGSFNNNTTNLSTTGTLVLNGVNTYTGDTIINGGTLRIGTNNIANGAVLGSGNYAGNIAIRSGGMLYISTNANQTLSGVISGDGALLKTYTGTLTLGVNNTYTGRTSITGATTSGAGTLEVSSFNSVVGGTASSSLGAPTTVANGTIDLGGPTNIQGPAVLRYIGSGETTDRVVNIVMGSSTTRTIDASGGGLLKFTSAFTSTSGTIANTTVQLIGNGNGEIVQGLPFTFNALTKNGSGSWTLGGTVENYNTLTVSAGTLILNGTKPSTAAVAVNGTSTLGGSGTIAGVVTVAAGAKLTPGTGASVGTLTFRNDLNISALAGDVNAGLLNYELGPIASSDKIVVAGNLNIGTDLLRLSDFNFTALGGLQNGTYKLITSGGITGSLDTVPANLTGTVGGGTGTLQITGNDLELVVSGIGGGTAYSTWASTNAPSGDPDDDFDGDGVSNAVEFVLGGFAITNDLGKLPVAAASGGNMTFTFNRATGSIDPGKTTVIIEVSTDLVTWTTPPSPYTVPDTATGPVNPGVTVVEDTSPGFDTVTLTVPQDAARKFARLNVVITP